MSKKSFWGTAFDGLDDTAAINLNELICEGIPYIKKWCKEWFIYWLEKNSVKKYRELKETEMKHSSASDNNNSNNVVKLESALEKYKSNMNDKEVQKEIIEIIGDETSENYLKALKKNDSYHFSYSFEYIAKNYGNDKYDIGSTNMDVSVNWSDSQLGYVISYNVPKMYKIEPNQGNSNADGFYVNDVYFQLISDLKSLGIGAEAIAL